MRAKLVQDTECAAPGQGRHGLRHVGDPSSERFVPLAKPMRYLPRSALSFASDSGESLLPSVIFISGAS